MKLCAGCNTFKESECFSLRPSRRKGGGPANLQGKCKKCLALRYKLYRRANPDKIFHYPPGHARKRLYGLEEGDYLKRLACQKELCGICKKMMTPPFVDHCHKTGVVRGLLCMKCNTGIGMLNDSVDTLASALSYLSKNWAEDGIQEPATSG